DTGAASYGWNVVRSGWTGSRLALETPEGAPLPAAFEGWISAGTADRLFELAGRTDLIDQAKKPGFKPVPLQVTTSVSIKNDVRKSASNNVLAKLPGSKHPDEYIIYTAHW